MGRSSWKPFFVAKDFIQQYQSKLDNNKKKNNVNIVENASNVHDKGLKNDEMIVYNRGTVVRQYMVGLKIQVYNGIRFFLVEITSEMVGHCLGEFAPTRKKPIPKKKKKKK